MAQECGFFNAEYQDGEYDRVYNAEQFAAYFASFIGNGIFGDQMDELVPLARTENNMSIDIGTGKGWINGWWYRNDETLNLPIALADGVLDRKDIVVLRWGNSERDMWLQVIQGEPSAEAVAPSIERDADYYDLKLCEVSIPAGTTKITQALITDTRLDSTVCGFVFALVNQIDTTALYLQFNAQFNTWFSALQEQFEGDVPAILQSQIDDLFGIISSRIESTSISTHAYVKDDLFIYENKLCKASVAISIGDTLSIGDTANDNCTQTSIIDEIPLGGGGGTGNSYFYNSWEDAEQDINNIDEGGMVYTNDGEDEPINARQVAFDDGTQAGTNLEAVLKANGKTMKLDYQNGAYGITVDGTFYKLGGTMIKAIYRGKVTTTTPVKRVYHVDLTNTPINPDKVDITLYGNAYASSNASYTSGFYPDNITTTGFDLVWAGYETHNVVEKCTIGWQIKEYV